MAKNKNTFGKLLAFTTTIAAIGGACYIFRDKIKQSSLYKLSAEKFSDIYDKLSNKVHTPEEEDDFFFDDEFEEPFSEDAKNEREYTSITINPKEEASDEEPDEEPDKVSASSNDTFEDETPDHITAAEDSIPTISFHSVTEPVASSTENSKEESAISSDTTEVTGYENEGLSDVSEDSDVLEDQDKLDF